MSLPETPRPAAAETPPAPAAGNSEHAYEALRGQILIGELAPGSTFSQVQLALQLGISRTPLREAVRRLQTEGLLRSEHNRRVRVSPLSTRDFEELYCIRIALDSLAIRISVPQLSADELDEAREMLELTTASAETGNLDGYREPHRRFHLGLYRHAGKRLLAQVEDLWDHAHRYRLLYERQGADRTQLMQMANREHAGILEAAGARDADACARRLAAHLARTALMTMIRVDHRHDPTRIRAALDLVAAESPDTEPDATVTDDLPVPGYVRDVAGDATAP